MTDKELKNFLELLMLAELITVTNMAVIVAMYKITDPAKTLTAAACSGHEAERCFKAKGQIESWYSSLGDE